MQSIKEFDLKQRLLHLCHKNRLHHLGSYFSALDIIDNIYQDMQSDDVFILSCGHAAAALYVVLEKYYGFDAQKLIELFGDHPKLSSEYKIHCSTGSLGLGILVAVGRAVADKTKNVYCLMSDGEAAEGSVWEALKFAHEYNVKNLKIYVNANGYSAYAQVDLEYLEKRIKAFHQDVKFVRTTVEHFDFLRGLDAHYYCMSDDDYERNKI